MTLASEKESLGFHLTGHPLDIHERMLNRYCTANTRTIAARPDRSSVRIGGELAQVRTRIVRNGPSTGKKMALATLHDKTGSIEAVIFSQTYARHARLIRNDAIVALFGRLDRSRGDASIIVDEVVPIEDLPRRFAERIELNLIECRQHRQEDGAGDTP